MNLFLLLPVFLGLTVIIQGALNKEIGATWGLSAAVALNAGIFFLASLGLAGLAYLKPEILPEFLRLKTIAEMKSWYLLPGLCGFLLVLGLPWSMKELGATPSFVLLVSTQIGLALFLDYFILKNPITPSRLIGGTLAIFGAILSLF